MMLPDLIALCGYSRVGKDSAAVCLIERGYTRWNLADVIKGQVDQLVRQHFGFSAFTEDTTQKQQIRRTLESWGEDNYRAICAEFLASLPERAVNTRLVRCREAEAWRQRGGVIVEIVRPGVGPSTPWEADRLTELRAAGHIAASVVNSGSVIQLHDRLLAALAA